MDKEAELFGPFVKYAVVYATGAMLWHLNPLYFFGAGFGAAFGLLSYWAGATRRRDFP